VVPQIEHVHRGNRLYIIREMIQTLHLTLVQSQKPSVSFLYRCLSQICSFLLSLLHCLPIFSCSVFSFIEEMRALTLTNKYQTTANYHNQYWG